MKLAYMSKSYNNVYGFNTHTFFDKRIFVPRLSPCCTIWTYGTLVAGCCPGNSLLVSTLNV